MSNPHGPSVTPESMLLNEQVRELWDREGLSGGAIAQRLGLTRNQVVGRVHRMGLASRRVSPQVKKVKNEPRARVLKTKSFVTPSSHIAIKPRSLARAQLWVQPSSARIMKEAPELSKNELRRQIAQALQNTAMLPKPVLTSEGH